MYLRPPHRGPELVKDLNGVIYIARNDQLCGRQPDNPILFVLEDLRGRRGRMRVAGVERDLGLLDRGEFSFVDRVWGRNSDLIGCSGRALPTLLCDTFFTGLTTPAHDILCRHDPFRISNTTQDVLVSAYNVRRGLDEVTDPFVTGNDLSSTPTLPYQPSTSTTYPRLSKPRTTLPTSRNWKEFTHPALLCTFPKAQWTAG